MPQSGPRISLGAEAVLWAPRIWGERCLRDHFPELIGVGSEQGIQGLGRVPQKMCSHFLDVPNGDVWDQGIALLSLLCWFSWEAGVRCRRRCPLGNLRKDSLLDGEGFAL